MISVRPTSEGPNGVTMDFVINTAQSTSSLDDVEREVNIELKSEDWSELKAILPANSVDGDFAASSTAKSDEITNNANVDFEGMSNSYDRVTPRSSISWFGSLVLSMSFAWISM